MPHCTGYGREFPAYYTMYRERKRSTNVYTCTFPAHSVIMCCTKSTANVLLVVHTCIYLDFEEQCLEGLLELRYVVDEVGVLDSLGVGTEVLQTPSARLKGLDH